MDDIQHFLLFLVSCLSNTNDRTVGFDQNDDFVNQLSALQASGLYQWAASRQESFNQARW